MRYEDVWPDGMRPGESCQVTQSVPGRWRIDAVTLALPPAVRAMADRGECTIDLERRLIETGEPNTWRADPFLRWRAEERRVA